MFGVGYFVTHEGNRRGREKIRKIKHEETSTSTEHKSTGKKWGKLNSGNVELRKIGKLFL